MKPRRGDQIKVHIDRLSVGGRGVARHEGLVIFIPFTAPDEDVEIELTLVKKNYAEGRLRTIAKASPSRTKPPCPVFGICGGCTWQHVSYDEQLKQKRSLVAESLKKFAGYEGTIEATVASPNEFRYRNRIQLHHSGPRMGFFKRGSHEIVDIDDCPITEERITALIPRLKKELAHEKAGRIELLASSEGRVGTRDVSSEGSHDSHDNPDSVTETTGPAFAQVNTEQNRQLIDAVIERIRTVKPSRNVYDLYAGSGNFTFPLSKEFPESEFIAVELNRESVLRGSERARTEAARIHFVESHVESFLISSGVGSSDVVVLDPPRAGCGPEVVTALIERKPRHIVYVSCHPVTLARDLRSMIEAGYRIELVRPFDMFPQTDHVETLVQLAWP